MRMKKAFVLFFVPCVLLLAQSRYVETGSTVWDMEKQFVRSQRVMVDKETIELTNNGDKPVVLGLNVQEDAGWKADNSPGRDTYVLIARFSDDRQMPEFDEYLDIVDVNTKWADDRRNRRFGDGILMPGETQFLWLKMSLPTETETGYGEKTIPLILTVKDEDTGDVLETLDLSIHIVFSPTPMQEMYKIKAGWNLLSWPFDEMRAAVDVFNTYNPPIAAEIYPYSAKETAYFKTADLNPGQGFCLFSEEDISIPMKGESYSRDITIELAKGWNLVGGPFKVVHTEVLDDNSAIQLPVYKYNPLTGHYRETNTMDPGTGYWILALEDTTITLQ